MYNFIICFFFILYLCWLDPVVLVEISNNVFNPLHKLYGINYGFAHRFHDDEPFFRFRSIEQIFCVLKVIMYVSFLRHSNFVVW